MELHEDKEHNHTSQSSVKSWEKRNEKRVSVHFTDIPAKSLEGFYFINLFIQNLSQKRILYLVFKNKINYSLIINIR